VTDESGPWTATVTVRTQDPTLVGWIERTLRPEAAREVPRSTAELHLDPDGTVTVEISARDSGAMRAALNTYLGWVHLSLATARAATTTARSGSPTD
jgi:tRNA threonylcarbamoyladenosine modification (KEOPS) complex  Pcc1 subunit